MCQSLYTFVTLIKIINILFPHFALFQESIKPLAKRVRKSLEHKWSTPGDVSFTEDFHMPETPVN